MGKVIGGGLPVGAYGGRREVMEIVAPAGPMYQVGRKRKMQRKRRKETKKREGPTISK